MTVGSSIIDDADTLDGVAYNVVSRNNFTNFYDYEDQSYKFLRYTGSTPTYYLDKHDYNKYSSEFFEYSLHGADDPTILASDYVVSISDSTFFAYVVKQNSEK
jgi:hypothetical protein